MKASDTRLTPRWVLTLVRQMFGEAISVDPCSDESNWTGAGFPMRPPHFDGLATPWGTQPVYCNPPYSVGQVIQWARKAISEAVLGAEIQMLTQADVSTQWFRLLRENCDAVCLLHRRVGFLTPDQQQMPGAKFGSAMWYFGPRRRRFRRFWEPHGWVLDGPGPERADG